MKIYDFSGPFLGFDGKQVEDATLALILGRILAADSKVINPRKAIIWGDSLGKNQNIEIDEADKKILIAFLENTEICNNLMKGRILSVLES